MEDKDARSSEEAAVLGQPLVDLLWSERRLLCSCVSWRLGIRFTGYRVTGRNEHQFNSSPIQWDLPKIRRLDWISTVQLSNAKKATWIRFVRLKYKGLLLSHLLASYSKYFEVADLLPFLCVSSIVL